MPSLLSNRPSQAATTIAAPKGKPLSTPESKAKIMALMSLIIVATIAAYLPVMFNFFVGDDFVHLTWLRHAVHQPELIAKNFYSSWLDGTTTKFYRPLISVFMVSDYMLWKTNGLGFHITNLLFHLTSTVLLFGVVRQAQQQLTGERNNGIALCSAAVFALYPLHPEAVSWITGRVDTIVTTFCLASIWSYLRYRELESRRWLAASLATMILGLLSKEMAITVPAVICAFEVVSPKPSFQRLFKTLPYWIVLAGYFVVRRLALGTFVGGYDDSLLFIANFKEFAQGWLHAVRMFLIPINKEMLGSHHWLTKCWELLTVGAFALLAVRAVRQPGSRRPIAFAIAWLVLSLLPVYKLFAIADDLQGSRLAYLATVPLSVLFAYGLCVARRYYLPAIFCAASLLILLVNNQPWRVAGQQANAIRQSLQEIYDYERSDPQTLLIGMPDHYRGAYISRNAIWGMTKIPQMNMDIWNCLTLNEFEPVHPFGFLKPSLVENKDKIRIYRWDSEAKRFAQVDIESGTTDSAERIANVPIEVAATSPKIRPEYDFAPPTAGWDTDFVQIDLDMLNDVSLATGADLLYANEITPEFQLGKRTHCAMLPDQKHQTLLFALRSLPEWSFGSETANLKLMLPPGATARINSIEVIPADQLIPRLSFDNAGYMGTKGYMHVGSDRPLRKLSIDASRIPGAASTEVEITRANLLFEEQNSGKYSTFAREHVGAPLTGVFELKKENFTTPGIYELRVWAKDKAGKLIGRSSDHIVISVDS